MVGKRPLGSGNGPDDATMFSELGVGRTDQEVFGNITLPDKERLVFGRVHVDLVKGNPCIVEAAKLLTLATELRSNPNNFSSLQDVRSLAQSALRGYESRLAKTGLEKTMAVRAHMVMCALIDDVALSGPWAGKSSWRQNSLSTEFHEDRVTPEFVFEFARDLAVRPEQSFQLAELVYVVLAIGFEGSFRTDPRGPILLTQHREHLLRTLRARKGSATSHRSVTWGGASKRSRGPAFVNPVTLVGAVVVIVVGVIVAATWGREEPKDKNSQLATTAPPLVTQTNVLDQVERQLLDRIRLLLRGELDAGVIIIDETDDAVVIRLPTAVLRAQDTDQKNALPNEVGIHLAAVVALAKGTTYIVGLVPQKETLGVDDQSGINSAKQLVFSVRRELQDRLGRGVDVIGLTVTAEANRGTDVSSELNPEYLHIVVPKGVPPSSSFTQQDFQPAWL